MKTKIINLIIIVVRIKFLFLLLNLKHLLVIMLIFEFIGLNILFLIIIFLYRSFIYLRLILLVLLACEARLGLSLLVGVVRSNYKNYVESFNVFII